MCNKKWILYNQRWPAQWLDWEEAPKNFPKSNLHQKKGHGHCLVVCCLSGPLQLSESQQNHYIWEVCSANQWDAPKTAMPATGTGQKGPNSSPWQHQISCHTTSVSKDEWVRLLNFASSPYSWPLTNWLLLLWASWLLFTWKMLPQSIGDRKCFPRVCWISKPGFLHDRNKNLIVHWQKCVDCNRPYFD